MIKQECIRIPDMILLLMKAEIIVCPGGAYFVECVFNTTLIEFFSQKILPKVSRFIFLMFCDRMDVFLLS